MLTVSRLLRLFLPPVLLAAGYALFSSSAHAAMRVHAKLSDASRNTLHDIVIVGAGSAGLYAAKTLIDAGYNVLIIEATDRIGGRVFSATLGDTRVELGAEEHYLATGNNPVWPALTQEYGAQLYVEGYQGFEAYSMDGGTTTCWYLSTAARQCGDDADVNQLTAFLEWYSQPALHLDDSTSLAQDAMAEYGVQAGDRSYHLYEASFAGGSFATSLDKLGARSTALQESLWELSTDIRVIGDAQLGYSDALQSVWWDDVLANSDLLLNRPVISINTTDQGVVVSDDTGAEHVADRVIVTVSIGVLQAEIIDFIPDLPVATVNAYNGIGMDMGMKIPLRFTNAWWETEGEPMSWLVTEGVAGVCWVPTDYKVGGNDRILMCYPMGNNAKALNDMAQSTGGGQLGNDAIINAVLNTLDTTFPEAPGAATATFIDGIVQNWGAAPYTLGAYSYPRIGTYTDTGSKRLELQAPVADNKLFFAGEATHNTNPSTVVGALQEGERAAMAIIALDSQSPPPQTPPPPPPPTNNSTSSGGGSVGGSVLLLGLAAIGIRGRRRKTH
ncbi:MAG: FAD-dependent oxidoreductase [Pseudomonadota bacterium]